VSAGGEQNIEREARAAKAVADRDKSRQGGPGIMQARILPDP
jgi:hypothetical protein